MKKENKKLKLFVVSDIHSFAIEFLDSLKQAGFEKNNKQHLLIVNGDIWDRGDETVKVYKYLKSVKNKILIKGNHEALFLDLLDKPYPQDHDFGNCTVDTVCQIANEIMKKKDPDFFADVGFLECAAMYQVNSLFVDDDVKKEWKKIVKIVKDSEYYKWLLSDEWKDYYEYDKYIFTHCFIPLINKDGLPFYYIENRKFEYMPSWRNKATSNDWYEARWGCPWRLFKDGYFSEEAKKGKVLVCGHWHTSSFFERLKNDYEHEGEIYFSKSLIGIDGGVKKRFIPEDLDFIFEHHQNVLVIDRNKCYNECGEELKEVRKKQDKLKDIPSIKDI